MNPMDWQEQVLPEDLQEIEHMLRAAPPPAPTALFERITASREIAVVVERMLLTDDPFAKRSQQYRTLISIAASALLMVGAFSVWRYVDSRTPSRRDIAKTPRVAAANQVARLPKITAQVPLNGTDRFLQPWPTSARVQYPFLDSAIRAPGAVLEPGARARIKPFIALYRRMTVDAKDRLLADEEIAVSLHREPVSSGNRWVLTSIPLSRNQRQRFQVDSIILDDVTLMPKERRLHGEGVDRYYRLTPTEMIGTDTLPEYFFRERVVGPGSRFEPVAGPLYWYKPLNRRHPLVLSEAHLALLLRSHPLWMGWTMSVSTVGARQNRYTGNSNSSVLNLRVTALDSLTVGTERIPSYRVEIDYGAKPDLWWINATTGELMRTERTTSLGKEITRLTTTR